jgi:UMF1 family MFS transporter
MHEFRLNDKKVINGWAFFDWANSAYALVISTAIFPAYFIAYTPESIPILGNYISNSSLYSFAVSFSYLLIAMLSPLLSGIADYGGRRMFFMKMFTIIGSISCMALFFFKGEQQLWLGTSAFILATIGFAGSIVFYNAYLPEIVSEDRFDSVSAKGFAYGYVGSVLLLLFNLLMILKPHLFGITDEKLPIRIAFVLVGAWWIGFAQISFRRLPKDNRLQQSENLVKKGYQELLLVWNKVKHQQNILRFLASFFFYSAGVQTVIYLAATFAKVELNFDATELIIIILILQLVAIGGAYLFAWTSKLIGNKLSLLTMITIWIIICGVAYFVTNKFQFYLIAALVGLVMGGIQSISRSTYSKLIEDRSKDLTSYFSFYDVLYKVSIVLGTFIFGVIDQITGGMRSSVLALAIFFVIGFFIMMTVNLKPPKSAEIVADHSI